MKMWLIVRFVGWVFVGCVPRQPTIRDWFCLFVPALVVWSVCLCMLKGDGGVLLGFRGGTRVGRLERGMWMGRGSVLVIGVVGGTGGYLGLGCLGLTSGLSGLMDRRPDRRLVGILSRSVCLDLERSLTWRCGRLPFLGMLMKGVAFGGDLVGGACLSREMGMREIGFQGRRGM
jgi:hypothetical protein